MRPSRLALALPLLLLFAGCGGDDGPTKPAPPSDGLPAGTPKADSPTHLMQRFEATWESQVEAQYALLLADDFRFHFSAASDPLLVNQYGENWRKSDEVAAITNLFDGFDNGMGQTVPGASLVTLTLNGVTDGADPDHADSTVHYRKIVVTALNGTIEVPGSPDPTTYQIVSRQELFLVRGDAAVLASGATADSTNWYMRKWDDLSAPAKGTVINPSGNVTVGHIKSLYTAPPIVAVTQ